jgi:hypothetical protein
VSQSHMTYSLLCMTFIATLCTASGPACALVFSGAGVSSFERISLPEWPSPGIVAPQPAEERLPTFAQPPQAVLLIESEPVAAAKVRPSHPVMPRKLAVSPERLRKQLVGLPRLRPHQPIPARLERETPQTMFTPGSLY